MMPCMGFQTDFDKIKTDRRADDRRRSFVNGLDADDYSAVLRSTTPLTERLAERQATADRLQSELRSGADMLAAFTRQELADADAAIERDHPSIDAHLRTLFVGKNNHAADFAIRALGATARGQTGDNFGAGFWPAAVAAVPLLDLSDIVFTGTSGADFEYGHGSVASATLVAEGGAITPSDITFSRRVLKAYGYKAIMQFSAEMATDSSFDFEGYASDRVVESVIRDLGDDLILGDGSGKPLSVYSGVSTVAAASATTVVLADIGALLEALPSQYLFSGRATLLLSAGAYHDLRREQLGTTGAGDGGMAVDPAIPGVGGIVMGVPFRVDTGLTDPTTATVTAVVGDFRAGYATRLTALRVETSDFGSITAADQRFVRVVLRADGAPTTVDAMRSLVMA